MRGAAAAARGLGLSFEKIGALVANAYIKQRRPRLSHTSLRGSTQWVDSRRLRAGEIELCPLRCPVEAYAEAETPTTARE